MDIRKTSELEPVSLTASLASPESAGESPPSKPAQQLERPMRKIRDDYSGRREVPSVAERAESPGGHAETSEAPPPEAECSTAMPSEWSTSTVEAQTLEWSKAAEAFCAAQSESSTPMDPSAWQPMTAPSLNPKDGKPPGAAVGPLVCGSPDHDYYDDSDDDSDEEYDEEQVPSGQPAPIR